MNHKYFTRSKVRKLKEQGIISHPCLLDDENKYYGHIDNNYICTKYICLRDKKNNNNSLFSMFKKYKIKKATDEQFKLIKQPLKLLKPYNGLTQNLQVLKYLELCKDAILFKTKGNEKGIYLLSNVQSQELIRMTNWQNYDDNFGIKISHFIQKLRIKPWDNMNLNIYHPSSFCYHGNYGEIPENEDKFRLVFELNLGKKFYNLIY